MSPGEVAAAMAPFLRWAAQELAPEETTTIVAALRRFVREGAGPAVQEFAATDAEIDAELARIEAEGK